MEDVEEFLSSERSRREVLTGAGSVAAAALAGCSGNGGDETPAGTETDSNGNTSEEPPATGDGNGTEEGTEGSQTGTDTEEEGGTEQYEDNEPDIEAKYEEQRQDEFFDNWMEFENPREQIPQDNYSLEEYPSLELLQYTPGNDGNDAYDPENENIYLGWREKNGDMILEVAVTYEWSDTGNIQDTEGHAEISSEGYVEGDADIEGILRNVVEGYSEVSDNMEEEYRKLL